VVDAEPEVVVPRVAVGVMAGVETVVLVKVATAELFTGVVDVARDKFGGNVGSAVSEVDVTERYDVETTFLLELVDVTRANELGSVPTMRTSE